MLHYILKRHFLDTVQVLKEMVSVVFLKGVTFVYPSVCVWKKVSNGGLGRPMGSFLHDVQRVE
jgi:hypothetical protein